MTQRPMQILMDGDCPLCRREASFLRRLDGAQGRLHIIDIAASGFDAAAFGATHDQVMGQIHGVLPDGRLIVGMEVFRQAYAAVGWGWLLAPTAWPLLRPLFDRFYVWFARNRMRLTGRHCPEDRCAPRAMGSPALTPPAGDPAALAAARAHAPTPAR